MQGLMQQSALTVDTILDHAKRWHADREVVTRSVEGPVVRTTYAQIHERAKRVSNALLGLGVRVGDRVATLAWNSGRHMEAWYGIMGIGAICHTLNPRLHPEQIAWIINHAEDRIIFVDLTFVPILEGILANCPSVEHVVILTDSTHMPHFQIRGVPGVKWQAAHTYETLVYGHSPDCAWGGFDENTACGLCYTSGTTGDPKGVLYSHRSNFLHTLLTMTGDCMGVTNSDVILPVVPMFHANAWGVAFSAPAVGAKLVMPGAKMDGVSIYELLETEGVTFSAAVPTVWQMLLQHVESNGLQFSTLKNVLIGGSAVPEAIVRGFDKLGVTVRQGWGMTETSPLGTVSTLTPELKGLSYDEQMVYRLKQGRPPLAVDLKLVNDAGERQPHDGEAVGRLMIKGPIVVREYFKGAGPVVDEEGFFDTGDVANIDAAGFMQITDRAKDVIKSGGEWISSIDIENIAVGHPKAALAAVIGVAHPKWDERPLLLVKLKEGESATKEEILRFLEGKIAKWWMPDDVAFVDDIPLGATGKIDKKLIRQRMADYALPAVPVLVAAAAAEAAKVVPLRTDPDPILHAPEAEDPAGKSEAPTRTAAVGAEESLPAEIESTPEAVAPEATAEAWPGPVEPVSEPIEETASPPVEAAEPVEPEPGPEPEAIAVQDDGEVPPPLPSMPDMTPIDPADAVAEPLVFPLAASEAVDEPPLPSAEPRTTEDAPLAFAAPAYAAPRRKPDNPWAAGYLNLAVLFALVPALLAAGGVLGARFGLWSWVQGYEAMLVRGATPALGWAQALAMVGALTGVLALIVALFAGFSKHWRKAALALAITAATWAGFAAWRTWQASNPPIHDVATDWSEPLMFSKAMLVQRGAGANPVDAAPALAVGSRAFSGRTLADVNAETCPDARPVTVRATPAQAFAHAEAVLQAAGLVLVTRDLAGGRLEATARRPLSGVEDDIVLRVRQAVDGARIDVRSVGRIGEGDGGANCRRIKALTSALTG
ncbi:long-chain-fatty-acid--CoA ligase [Caulobacter mirabilis]|uniref:3-methylmercaptopropionyl-CoA ligase n=1 Tax=Caulobacter mirabilis TaxID=69666 RepID=A0A2D2AVA8_9CAUL|nr:long-chain-fatty-acid--CoA ligase [Caulobacter mirabilis]ATQ41928.1 fatty-acyl-CoA synthase [Caulobacter mirabilis]